ncbi:MAG: O-antigen ligase family protein [Kiritimatiellia bacterium]
MVHRLLTKYGLIAHVACICLFPVSVFGQSRVAGLTPLFWLALMVVEWMFLLPSVKRGETLVDARRRMLHALLWDPFLYAGVGLVALMMIQYLNSGLELVYLPDADIWQLSDPTVTWAPFAVESNAVFTHLAWFTACCVVGVALRAAAGRGAKRVLLQLLACASGAISLCMVTLASCGSAPYASWTNGTGAPAAGTFFGFWMLLGIGLFVNKAEREQRMSIPLFILAGIGNLLGVLFFASPLMTIVFPVIGVLLLFYGMVYLAPLTPKGMQLKLFVIHVLCLGVIAASLVYLFPQNPVAEKMKSALPVAEHWTALAARHEVRSDAALSIWQQHPWTGVGADGFYHYVALAVTQDQWSLIEQDRALVFSDGLQFLCEHGVFGAGLVLAAIIALLVPLCYRARVLWQNKMSRETSGHAAFLLRLSPIVVTGCVAAVLCCLESFIASPFRAPAVMLSWVCVLAALPAFLPQSGT